jgi:Raf kinase inhibitor-like YbhB/YbcL family protein
VAAEGTVLRTTRSPESGILPARGNPVVRPVLLDPVPTASAKILGGCAVPGRGALGYVADVGSTDEARVALVREIEAHQTEGLDRRLDLRDPGATLGVGATIMFHSSRPLRVRSLTPLIVCWVLCAGFATPQAAAAIAERSGAEKEADMNLTSPAFDPGGRIPSRHTCDGEDLSPALAWNGVPEGTRSFALVMDDPDAPPGTWVHWVLYGIGPASRELGEGIAKRPSLPDGARQGLCWGVSSFARVGYYGPCPPPGGPHRYSFRLYALDVELELEAKATKDDLEAAMNGHVLAEAELVGLYGR